MPRRWPRSRRCAAAIPAWPRWCRSRREACRPAPPPPGPLDGPAMVMLDLAHVPPPAAALQSKEPPLIRAHGRPSHLAHRDASGDRRARRGAGHRRGNAAGRSLRAGGEGGRRPAAGDGQARAPGVRGAQRRQRTGDHELGSPPSTAKRAATRCCPPSRERAPSDCETCRPSPNMPTSRKRRSAASCCWATSAGPRPGPSSPSRRLQQRPRHETRSTG